MRMGEEHIIGRGEKAGLTPFKRLGARGETPGAAGDTIRNLAGLLPYGSITHSEYLDRSREIVTLSILEYHVLLALARGALHGYAIKDAVAAESDGSLTPRAGSLYRVLARQLVAGLVVETNPGSKDAHPGLARRYYALTAAGRRALAAEASRLQRTTAMARKRLGLARDSS
jgi:DNA-binding PadR family transcriptional regulator